jgi:hypothetical protein
MFCAVVVGVVALLVDAVVAECFKAKGDLAKSGTRTYSIGGNLEIVRFRCLVARETFGLFPFRRQSVITALSFSFLLALNSFLLTFRCLFCFASLIDIF